MPLVPRTRSIALKILGISILVMFLAVIALGAIFYPHSILIELSGLEHSALSPFYAIIDGFKNLIVSFVTVIYNFFVNTVGNTIKGGISSLGSGLKSISGGYL
jgi:hypothetical protein